MPGKHTVKPRKATFAYSRTKLTLFSCRVSKVREEFRAVKGIKKDFLDSKLVPK